MRRRRKREVKIPQIKAVKDIEITLNDNRVSLELKFWDKKDSIKFNKVISEVLTIMLE